MEKRIAKKSNMAHLYIWYILLLIYEGYILKIFNSSWDYIYETTL